MEKMLKDFTDATTLSMAYMSDRGCTRTWIHIIPSHWLSRGGFCWLRFVLSASDSSLWIKASTDLAVLRIRYIDWDVKNVLQYWFELLTLPQLRGKWHSTSHVTHLPVNPQKWHHTASVMLMQHSRILVKLNYINGRHVMPHLSIFWRRWCVTGMPPFIKALPSLWLSGNGKEGQGTSLPAVHMGIALQWHPHSLHIMRMGLKSISCMLECAVLQSAAVIKENPVSRGQRTCLYKTHPGHLGKQICFITSFPL